MKRDKILNAVICGGDEKEAWLHRSAYGDVAGAELRGIYSEGAGGAKARAAAWDCRAYDSFKSVLTDPDVHVVELLAPMPGRAAAAEAALSHGKHVLMAPPFAESLDLARRLQEAARRAKTLLMSYDNWLYYPPVQKVLRLTAKNTIGRVAGIRLQSLIGGNGGWDTYLNPDFQTVEPDAPATLTPALMFREMYEKLTLALAVLGPIRELFFISPAPRGEHAAAVLTWKHTAVTTYGSLDITLAPDLTVRSAYDPRDDHMELTGSAGIIWLTRGRSQLRAEPTVRVYRGSNQFAYGVMDDDWRSGYTRCLAHFVECATRRKKQAPDLAHAVRAVQCAEAAARSAESGDRIML